MAEKTLSRNFYSNFDQLKLNVKIYYFWLCVFLESKQTTTFTISQVPITTAKSTTESFETNNINIQIRNFLNKSRNDFSPESDLFKMFEKNFNDENWENVLSYAFASEMMRQNESKISRKINFSNITITLLKVSSKDELDQELTKSEEITLSFRKNLSNLILLNSSQVEELKLPVAIVSASINSNFWINTSLSSLNPLISFDAISNDSSTLELNKNFNVLASDSSILSVSAYTLDQKKTLKKRSIAAKPTFEMDFQRSLRIIESRSGRKTVLNELSYSCVFLKTDANLSWSNKGCSFVKVEQNVVHCSCNHTTSFGVMLAVRTIKVPDAVTMFLTVLECISIFALILTITLLLLLRKKIRNDRTVVQLNLATSLLLLHVFFVLGGSAKKFNSLFCEACAILSHFFVLSSGFWMLNEGIVLYFRTCKKAISFNLKKLFPFLFGLAWGLPLLLVSIVAGIGIHNSTYMDNNLLYDASEGSLNNTKTKIFKYDACWINTEYTTIYSVIVPLSIVLFLTTCIVIKTAISISRMKKAMNQTMKPRGKQSTNESKIKKQNKISRRFKKGQVATSNVSVALRAVILLLSVLGVTWVLGFMVNIRGSEEVFLILHGLVNGLQGVFIFCIYCVNNAQLRWAARRKWQEVSLSRGMTDGFQSSTKVSKVLHRPNSKL